MLSSVPLLLNSRPVYYLLHITSKCNAHCSHCFYWEEIRDGKTEEDLNFEAYEKLSQSMGKVLVVNLCGAEAYVRPDLCEIAHLFSRNNDCRLMTIPSNGFLTDRIVEYAGRLCRENPSTFFRFAFSLDGPQELHDRIRKVPGLFQKACETIRQIAALKKKYSNFVLLTSTVFSRDTQEHILEFLDWIKEHLPVEQTNVTFVRGNPLEKQTLDVDGRIYEKVLQKIQADAALAQKDKSVSALIPYSMFLNTMDTVEEARRNPGKRVFHCFAGEKFVVIGRKGEVSPCEILDEKYSLGSLKDFNWDIQALLASKRAKEVVDWINQEHCSCTWECAIQASKLFDAKQWPALAMRAVRVAVKS